MPPSTRRLVPRRRRADEGEEEGSLAGDIEDESLSEGSALSGAEDNGDAEASDASLEDERDPSQVSQEQSPAARSKQPALEKPTASPSKEAASKTTSAETFVDNEALLHGLKSSNVEAGIQQPQFNDAPVDDDQSNVEATHAAKPPMDPPTAPRNETLAEKSRREHQEYIRQRNSNPAFVPNRGGFFLHDDRSSMSSGFNGRPFARGRGRGFEPGVHGPRLPLSEPTENKWAHDLHDTHESVQHQGPRPDVSGTSFQPKPAPSASTPSAPNRTFSFSVILGNVAVNVALPGMAEKKVVSNIVKKHHTLLPQHRPPLRRDKPVRISIPDLHPRYIFPSTERSFIFIPRALRPNQQSYFRGRGRGSFHGSRRTSIFGGSAYTPSVAMSRKSSYGGLARDNVRSPAGSTTSRTMMMEQPRPIVRLPSAGMMPPAMPMSMPMQVPMTMPMQMPMHFMPGTSQPPDPMAHMHSNMAYGFHSTSIPMHQPRPQKSVSVADIESPASLSVKAPQQQQEQPFHQQMPGYAPGSDDVHGSGRATGHGTGPGGTPLSHIPESAIYAQAFQPVPYMQPQMMYGAPYGNPAMFYPPMNNGMQFGAAMAGMPMGPGYGPPAMHPGVQQHPQMNAPQQPRAMADGSNEMVYYYDPSQYGDGSQQQQYGMIPTMNPQAAYYYPPGPNGVYYGTQQA